MVRHVPVPGGDLEVELVGAGPPVVLSHGWTLDRRMWQPQIVALADRFCLITYDRRGFGRSTAPPGLSREPDDIITIADALGLDRFALVGMSQGGRVALALAAHHADRIQAVALQGAPLSDVSVDADSDEQVPFAQMVALARRGEMQSLHRLWRTHRLMQVNRDDARTLIGAIADDYAARDLREGGGLLDVRRADVARISAPTMIITGAREPRWRHQVADVLEATLVRSTRVTIPDAEHLCNLCRPVRYNEALGDFLADASNPVHQNRAA